MAGAQLCASCANVDGLSMGHLFSEELEVLVDGELWPIRREHDLQCQSSRTHPSWKPLMDISRCLQSLRFLYRHIMRVYMCRSCILTCDVLMYFVGTCKYQVDAFTCVAWRPYLWRVHFLLSSKNNRRFFIHLFVLYPIFAWFETSRCGEAGFRHIATWYIYI